MDRSSCSVITLEEPRTAAAPEIQDGATGSARPSAPQSLPVKKASGHLLAGANTPKRAAATPLEAADGCDTKAGTAAVAGWTKAFDCVWDVAVLAVWATTVHAGVPFFAGSGMVFAVAFLAGRLEPLVGLRLGAFSVWDLAVFAVWASQLDVALTSIVVAAALFWAASATTKVLDDMVDGDGAIGEAAARLDPGTRLVVSSALVAGGSACVIGAAWLSPLASLAMASQAVGCLVAGKIDCWQHAATMGTIVACYVAFSPSLVASAPWLLAMVLAAVLDEVVHDAADAWKPTSSWGVALRQVGIHRVFADGAALAAGAACGWGREVAVVWWSGYEGVQPCMPAVAGALLALEGKAPRDDNRDGKAAAGE